MEMVLVKIETMLNGAFLSATLATPLINFWERTMLMLAARVRRSISDPVG
jgi:hypothetical protein